MSANFKKFIVLDLYFRRLFIQKINKTHFEAKPNSFNESPLGAGPNSYLSKGRISKQKNKKKIDFFFQEKFTSILGTGCPKIGHRRFGHRTARHPKLQEILC